MCFKFLLVLSFFSTVVSVGASLKCYTCAGTGSSDCARGRKSSMVIQTCANVSQSLSNYAFLNDDEYEGNDGNTAKFQTVCLQLFETDYQPKLFARGCGIVPTAADPCEFVRKYIHIQGCQSCRTNLCNKRHQQGEDNSLVNNTIT